MKRISLKYDKKRIILFISLILFLLLTYNIFNNRINEVDYYIQNLIINIRNDRLTKTMTLITNISSAYSLVVITVLLGVIIKNKKNALLIALNLILAFLTSQLVKLIFRRGRPINIELVEAVGFSYPSGHSMVSMAYFGFIAYLIFKNISHNITKIILITSLFVSILAIGISRIYLGVHYPSDVIGGFLLSISYLMLFISSSKEINKGDK